MPACGFEFVGIGWMGFFSALTDFSVLNRFIERWP